jgi:thimet oligopeptidase
LVPGLQDRQLSEGALLCNFSSGLMEHREVVTLFHEFGHLVHQVLAGRQMWAATSGITTEWDFVEAPSQLLEEWAWDPAVLASFATNATGEAIPLALVERMRKAEEFGKGFLARNQMFLASVSYRMHQDIPADPTDLVREQQAKYDLFEYPADTHFHASFGHLDGYGSGYYTYMWSLVIAKDLFSHFDPDDLFNEATARRYRDLVLAAGGSGDAADLVSTFLQRPYSFDSFGAWLNQS